MSIIKPIYRLELRAPRTETIFTGVSNSAETAILQPPAGAQHRDWFRVASEAISFSAKLAGTTLSWVRKQAVLSWPTTDISIELWVRSDDLKRSFGLFSYAVSTPQDNEVLLFWNEVTAQLQFFVKGAGPLNVSGFAPDGKWHQYVFTWRTDTDAAASYIDGVASNTATITAGSITGGGSLYIGQEQANVDVLDTYRALDGAVSMVRVYTRVLSAQEVAEHYRGIYTSETGLVLHWDFAGMGRGTSVVTVTDRSGTGNDGTAQGVEWIDDTPTGYKPYMSPDFLGRSGRIDMEGRSLDIGSRSITIQDQRVGTDRSNLKRWWSAFFGDGKGRPRGQLKAVFQESLDDGVTFSDLVVGRSSTSALDRLMRASIEVRDETEALKRHVFVGQPHSSLTYIATPTLLPLGIIGSDYGTVKATLPLGGTARDATISGAGFQTVVFKRIELNAAAVARIDNAVTKELRETIAPNTHPMTGTLLAQMISLPNFSGTCRAKIKHTSGALNGSTGDYRVGLLNYSAPSGGGRLRVTDFAIQALPTGDKGALALPAAGVTVELHLFADAPATTKRPLLLNDVDPATLLQDMCDGKFGYLWRAPETLAAGKAYGDVKWTVATNGLAAHVGTRPPFRGIITENEVLIDWIEGHLLQQYNWAIFLDRSGRLNLVDLNMPASLAGIATLTDTDIIDDQDLSWEHDPTAAIGRVEFKRYLDIPLTVDVALEGVPTGGFIGRLRPDVISPVATGNIDVLDLPIIIIDVGTFDHGDESVEIDASGYRTMDGEALQNQDRGIYLENKLIEIADQLKYPYAWGLTMISVECRRTATVNALSLGSLVLIAGSQVPDPTTHLRGGTRLTRVIEMTEQGARTTLRLVDLAVNVIAVAPSLAQPAQETGNTYTGVTSVLTLNASLQPAEVRYAVTDTATGSAPADTSPLWSVVGIFKASGTVTIRNVPPNMRVWVQGRTLPASDFEPQLPSAWTLAAGTGRVDTAALPAPSAPTTAAISGQSSARTRRVNWTNGATDLMTEVLLATPTTDPRRKIATVLPGSTSYDLFDLIPSTTYRVGVRHSLGGRFYSAEVTADFTTDSTGSVAPNMGGIAILR